VNALLDAPGWMLGILTIGLACGCSVGLLAFARWALAVKPTEHHNEVLGMLMSAGGIFCAIVVALAVFVVWDHLSTARQAEVDQGAALIALYHDAETLPDPARTEVETSIRDYTTSMIRDEFPALARGQSSDTTERLLSRMNAAVRRRLGSTSAPDQVTTVERAQYQLVLAGGEGMPPLLWVFLTGSCVLLLLMAAPLFMENARYHVVSSVLLGCALGASLFLILVADHPFHGPMHIEPSQLSDNLHTYSVMDSEAAGRASAP
jgi:hypothetical protein